MAPTQSQPAVRIGRVVTYTFDFFFPTPDPPTIVTVSDVDGARLQELLDDDPVLAVLSRRHPDWMDGPGNPRVAEDVLAQSLVRIEPGLQNDKGFDAFAGGFIRLALSRP